MTPRQAFLDGVHFAAKWHRDRAELLLRDPEGVNHDLIKRHLIYAGCLEDLATVHAGTYPATEEAQLDTQTATST